MNQSSWISVPLYSKYLYLKLKVNTISLYVDKPRETAAVSAHVLCTPYSPCSSLQCHLIQFHMYM